MNLPFTADQFFAVFHDYNLAVWPAQVFLVAAALIAAALSAVPLRWSGAVISAILALLWAWMAVAYHLAFFTAINPLAYAFSALSLAGALVFLWQGVIRRRIRFKVSGSVRGLTGIGLIMFALIIYPAWSILSGHAWPAMPTFGLPCPVTIFTIGILCLAVPPFPRSVLLVPVLWSAIGGQAAFLLGVTQDLALIVAGLIGIMLAMQPKDGYQ